MDMLRSRVMSLVSRTRSFFPELKNWINNATLAEQSNGEAKFRNRSQLEIIQKYYEKINERLQIKGDALAADYRQSKDIQDMILETEVCINQCHYMWGFYRSKLIQRYTPDYTDLLFSLDSVAKEIYEKISERISDEQIKKTFKKRPFPLAYFQSDNNTMMISRQNLLLDEDKDFLKYLYLEDLEKLLGQDTAKLLPVKVIGVPWDYITSPAELPWFFHEVGHLIDDELGFISKLLENRIEKCQEIKKGYWTCWINEITADVLALFISGPIFFSCVTTVLQPNAKAFYQSEIEGKHPPHVIRILFLYELCTRIYKKESEEFIFAEEIYNSVKEQLVLFFKENQFIESFIKEIKEIIELYLSLQLDMLNRQKLIKIVNLQPGFSKQQEISTKMYEIAEGIDDEILEITCCEKFQKKLKENGFNKDLSRIDILSAVSLSFEKIIQDESLIEDKKQFYQSIKKILYIMENAIEITSPKLLHGKSDETDLDGFIDKLAGDAWGYIDRCISFTNHQSPYHQANQG